MRPANAELDLRTLLEDLVSSLRCLAAVQNDQSKLCAVLVYEGHEMIRGQELQTIGKEAIIANEKEHSFTLHLMDTHMGVSSILQFCLRGPGMERQNSHRRLRDQ